MPDTLNQSAIPYENFLRLKGFHEENFIILIDRFFETGHFSAEHEAFNFLIQFDFPMAEREEMYQKLLLYYQNTSKGKSPLEILPKEYNKYRTLTKPPHFFEFSPPFIDPFKRAIPPARSSFNEPLKCYKLLNEIWKHFLLNALKLPDLSVLPEEINTWVNELNKLENKNIISAQLFIIESSLLEENKKHPHFEKMTQSLDLAAFEKFKALHPGKTTEDVQKEWASYNMGGFKRTEFSVAVLTENRVPEWAEVHKINSMLTENRYRFTGIQQLADQAIKTAYIQQKNTISDPHYFRKNFSREYLEAYIKTAGKAREKNLTVLDTVTHPKRLIAFESPFPETSFFEKIPANRDHDVRNWGVIEVLLTASDSGEAKKHIILQVEDDYDSMIKSARLTGENPNAVWVQMNKKGDYQFYGNLQSFINQEVVLTVVGHIREKNDPLSLANLSLADYSARELVEQLNVFSNKTGVKIKKNGGIFLKNVNPSNNIIEYDRRFKNFEQECHSRIRLHPHLTFNPVFNASNPLNRGNPGEPEQPIIKKPRAETETGITQDKIRVIFQLENKNDIVEVADILASKHPSDSIVMRYAKGHLLMEGNFKKLKNNITLLLLGHGGGGPNNAQQDNITLGGYNATQLAELIQVIPAKLSEKSHTRITIDKVVLLGCATASGEPEAPTGLLMDVAFNLQKSLNPSDLPKEIVGYSSRVKITANNHPLGAGHRVLLKDDEKEGNRISLMLNADNEYVPGPEKQKSVAVTDGLHSGYLPSISHPKTQKGGILTDALPGSVSSLASSQKNSMRFFQRSSTAMQVYGYFMLLKQLKWYFRRDIFDSLPEEEKQQFLLQRTLTLLALVSSASIDASQLALSSYQKSAQKIFEKPFRVAQTPAEQNMLFKHYLNQMKWLSRGLVGLNLLSSTLDLYLACDAFSQASLAQDPAFRRDLIFSGVLSSASVLVNLSTSVTMAIGGTALSAVGLPAALIAGAGIMLAGFIYTAVREMEEIQKYVRLTNGERFEGGVRAFLGMRQPAHFINPMMHVKQKAFAQETHLEALKHYMKRFVRSQKGVKHLYYSQTDVVMDNGKFYRVLKGHDRLLSPPQLRATGIPRLGVFDLHNNELVILETDIVDAAKAQEVLQRYKNEKTLGSHRYSDLRIEDSDYKFYTPIGINEKNEQSLDALINESAGYQEKVGIFALPAVPKNTSGLTRAENLIPLTQVDPGSTDHRAQTGDFDGDGYKDIFFFSERGSYLHKGNKSGFYFGPVQEIKDIPPHCYSPAGDVTSLQRWVGNINGVDQDGISRDDLLVVTDVNGQVISVDLFFAQPENRFTVERIRLSLPLYQTTDGEKKGIG